MCSNVIINKKINDFVILFIKKNEKPTFAVMLLGKSGIGFDKTF